jgi:hypothetical protein
MHEKRKLHEDGAFTLASAPLRGNLLKACSRWFRPHFPVVDEPEIWSSHKSRCLSSLLLQTMLFIGVIHCEESTLEEFGWGNRRRAKYQLYSRAKDIYDAEYETKKLVIIEGLFLVSFWRADALLEKDVRHWLGAVISLAQMKDFHRSGAENETTPQNSRGVYGGQSTLVNNDLVLDLDSQTGYEMTRSQIVSTNRCDYETMCPFMLCLP